MKKILSLVSLLAVFILSGVALADAPVVSITGITGPDVLSFLGNTLTVSAIPTTVGVNGAVLHDPNLNPVNNVNLYVNDVLTSTQAIPNGSGSSYNFSLPWTIPAADNYTLKITAKHGDCPSCAGTATEDVLVVLQLSGGGGGGGGPSVNCPAAPAVAVVYLQSKNIKSGGTQWKAVITDVAHQTGSDGQFWAKYACGGSHGDVNATDYANRVKAYIISYWKV